MSDTALPSRSGVTIRRAASVGDDWGTLTLRIGDTDPMTLPPDGVRTLFLHPKPVQVELLQGDRTVLSQRLDMPADTKMYLTLDLAPQGWLARLTGRPAQLTLTEASRAHLAPYDPGLVQMLTQQIWIGTAESKAALFDLMEERDAFYSEENEEAEGTDDFITLSAFADAMGAISYDHDFLEYGWNDQGDDLETRFKGHSWVDQWAPLVRARMSAPDVAAANAFIILGVDDRPQIRSPRDVNTAAVSLRYLGEIEHPSR